MNLIRFLCKLLLIVTPFVATSVFAQAATQAAAPSAAQPANDAAAPDALVRTLSEEVLETIRNDAALKSGDLNRINKLIDEKVLPHVNFEKMTRLAVSRGWRTASADQRSQLTAEFRALLVRTYSGALSAVKDQKVKVLPFRMKADETDVVVRSVVVVPGRAENVQLDYRLEKTDKGWKIYDINVLGVWLVENYKNQFSAKINAEGVDGLIKQLKQQNSQNSEAPEPKKS